MSETDFEVDLGSLRYRFGFICFRRNEAAGFRLPNGWTGADLGEFRVLTHPEASVRVLRYRWGTAIVVGEVFVAHGAVDLEEVLDRIAAGRVEYLDRLGGRFALLLVGDSWGRAFHDPMGSRTISYTLDGALVVGSHSTLVAEVTGESIWPAMKAYLTSDEYRAKRTRFLPGDRTMFENVVRLAPNNSLDLMSGQTQRYWPRREIDATSLEDFYSTFDEYLKRYAAYLRKFSTPVLGLTGGVDSRTLIAGLGHHGAALRLVTWDRLPAEETRRLRPMIEHLGWPHHLLDVSYKSDDASFKALRRAANLNSGYWRGASYLTAQTGLDASPSDVFVRGLGGEIISGFYTSASLRSGEDVLAMLVRHYYTRAVKRPSHENLQFTTKAFEGFMTRANYHAPFFNVPAHELSYWEHRMGMWGAELNNEFDPAMPAHAGMNSRELFRVAWGLPESDRRGKELLVNVIRRYDPALAEM